MSDNFRCERCEKIYIAEVVKTSQNKNVYIDFSRIKSRCKIPRFTHNHTGHEIVIYWDCENQTEIVYSQKDWLKKRAMGEL